eukprot:SAG31_NODE_1493_length_8110_cov_1.991020_3_plen_548_part_00
MLCCVSLTLVPRESHQICSISVAMLLAGRGLTPLCKALLLHGADSNGPANRDGWTALHYAAAQGRTGPTKLLLQSGANVNARSVEGQTALHFSCAKNAAATSEALVEGGADLRVISARGATALHACYNNKGEGCCKVLLHKAAQIGSLQALIVARDVNGKTALDLATAVVNRPLATLLRHTVAAMIIQVSARKFTRRQLDFKAAMATRIQRIYRGRHTRKQYKQTVRARDLRLNHAARVIQRRYRKWAGNRKKRDVLGSSAQHQTVYIDDLEKETATEWDKEEAKEVRSAIDKRRREDRKMRQEEAIAHQEQMALEDRKRGEAKRRQERREQEMAESSAAGSERSFADRQDIGEERPMMISDRSNDAPSRGSQRPGRGPDMAGAGSNDKTASGGGAMDGMFALVAEELQADEAERKRNRGPGIDLGAIVKSLEQLETRTIVRFGQLQEAVAIMASKVGVLEQKLNADLEYDHLVHVQAARERQRKGFFHEVKHMSATVSKMREEHQAAVAQDSVLRGEVLDDGALHPSLEEQDFANAEKKSKSCVLQ